jgi:hypothetical protein
LPRIPPGWASMIRMLSGKLLPRLPAGRFHRRRLKYRVLSVAACGVLVASASTIAVSDGTVVRAARDLASIMRDRSPGERASGNLIKSKRLQAAVGDGRDVPSARALAKTRTRVAPAGPNETTSAAGPAVFAEEVPDASGPVVIASPALADAFASPPGTGASAAPLFASLPVSGGGGAGGFIGLPGGGGGVTPPGGGAAPDIGSAPPIGDTPPGSATPPLAEIPPVVVMPPISVVPPGEIVAPISSPVAAVPDPSTWITMIFGFGAVGSSLRRNRRKLKRLASVKDIRGA